MKIIAETIKGINVVIGAETTGLSKALSDVNKKSRDIQSELKQVEKLLKLDPGNTELLAQKQKLLTDAVANTSDKLSSLKTAQEQVNEQFAKGEINEGQYRAFQREVAKTEQELQGFEGQLKQTTPELKKMGQEAESVSDKVKKVGEGAEKAGKNLSIGLTAPIIAIGTAGVAAFKSVDEALDTIITKTGATGDAADGLTDSFNEVASRVPDDLLSVGEAIGEVNTQFGFLGKELEDNSQLMLQFASINGTDVTSSSIAAKQAIEAYGMANSDLNVVLDAVTKTAQDTGQSVDFLFEKAVAGAPQIKALGLTFAEGTALIGGFEKAGVDSAGALSSLSKAQVVFAKDGKTMEQGLNDTIKAILNAKSETDALTAAAEVFGTKGAVRMVDAIKRGTFNLEEFANAGTDAAGAVTKTFEATLDPIDEAAVAANNAKLAMAEVGNAIQVALLPFMKKMSEVLKSVAEWFRSLSPAAMNAILVFAGLAAAIGPVLLIIGKIITVVSGLSGAFAVLTGPVGIVVAAIAALAAGMIYLYNNNETVKNALNAAWEFLKSAAMSIFNALKEFWAKWGDDILGFFSATWEIIKTVFQTVFNVISEVVKTVFGAIKDFWDKWGDTIIGIFKGYFEILKIFWSTIFNAIFAVVKAIFDKIKSFWDTWGDTIMVVFKTIFNVVKTIFEGAWNNIKIVIETVIGVISGIIKTFLSIFKGDWAGAWEGAKQVASSIWNGITGIFKNSFETMKNVGKNIIEGLINGIKSMASVVVETAKDIANSIGDSVKDFFGIHSPSRLMLGYGKNIVQGLANGISETARQAVKSASAVSDAVAGAMAFDVSGVSSAVSALNGVSAPSVAGTTTNSTSVSFADMFRGANFNVRNDNDIKSIAQELGGIVNQNLRAQGGV